MENIRGILSLLPISLLLQLIRKNQQPIYFKQFCDNFDLISILSINFKFYCPFALSRLFRIELP